MPHKLKKKKKKQSDYDSIGEASLMVPYKR